jgi:hypothetical protein
MKTRIYIEENRKIMIELTEIIRRESGDVQLLPEGGTDQLTGWRINSIMTHRDNCEK